MQRFRTPIYLGIAAAFVASSACLSISGCTSNEYVSPEKQAEGRKSKSEALKNLTSPTGATESKQNARSGRRPVKAGHQEQEP